MKAGSAHKGVGRRWPERSLSALPSIFFVASALISSASAVGGTTGVLSTSPAIVFVDPAPTSVELSVYESNDEIRVFNETQGVALGEDIAVDGLIPQSGNLFIAIEDSSDLVAGFIPAGTVVYSHLIHMDTVGTSQVILEGAVTFHAPIIGLFVITANLDSTDSILGLPSVAYPDADPEAIRAWELDSPSGRFEVSANRRTLYVRGFVETGLDEIRVITALPPAAPLTTNAVTREWTLLNQPLNSPLMISDVVSRELTIANIDLSNLPPVYTDVVSREFTIARGRGVPWVGYQNTCMVSRPDIGSFFDPDNWFGGLPPCCRSQCAPICAPGCVTDCRDEALFGSGFDPSADGYPSAVVFGNWCDTVANCTLHEIAGGDAESGSLRIQDQSWTFDFRNNSAGSCSPPPPANFEGSLTVTEGVYVGEHNSQTGQPGNAILDLYGGTLVSRFGHIGNLSAQRSFGTVRLGQASARWFANEYLRVGVAQNPDGNPDLLQVMSGSKMFVGDHLEVRQSGRVFLDGGGMRVGSLEDNGNPLDGMVIYPFGDVSGNGVIVGSQRIVCYGLISPGASPGTLTIDGDVTMEGSATLSIELGGIAPGEFDQLIVTGNAVVSGTVNVSFVNGFSPTVGDAFPIIQSGSQDGTFNTVVMPPGYTGECACSGSGLSIVVTSANPNIPAASAWGCIALVLLIVTAGTLVLRTKADCG